MGPTVLSEVCLCWCLLDVYAGWIGACSLQPFFFGTVISFPLSYDTASHSQRDVKGPYCIHTRLVFISASFLFKLTAPSLQGPDCSDDPLVVVCLEQTE